MWFVVFIFATEVQTLSCIYHFFILNLRRVLSELGQFFTEIILCIITKNALLVCVLCCFLCTLCMGHGSVLCTLCMGGCVCMCVMSVGLLPVIWF